jgi:hypothetical protein
VNKIDKLAGVLAAFLTCCYAIFDEKTIKLSKFKNTRKKLANKQQTIKNNMSVSSYVIERNHIR